MFKKTSHMNHAPILKEQSPIRLLLIILISIFLGEGAVMFVLGVILPELSPLWTGALDSLALMVIMLPILYFLHYKPSLSHYKELADALEEIAKKGAYLESILRSSTDISIVATDLDLRVCYYNPVSEDIFGYAVGEVIDTPIYRLFSEDKDALAKFENAIEIVRKVGEHKYTIEKKSDGPTRHIDTRVSSVKNDKNELIGFSLVSQDITQSINSEAELRDSHEMLESVIDNIPQYVFWKDINLIYRGCNRNFAIAAGVGEPENVTGKTDYDLAWLKEESDAYRETDRKVMSADTAEYDILEHRKRADGRYVWLRGNRLPLHDSKGVVVGVLGSYEDITDRKKLEDERARLATAIEYAAEAVIITDNKGMIQYVNPAFRRITGYLRNEVINRNTSILKSGKHGKSFYKSMWETIASRKVWKSNIVNRKKDGSLFEAEMSISPVMDSSGEIVSYISVQRDTSKEMTLEKQIRHARKMEVVGTMAGGIAHDFNNILSAILGYTELAIADAEGNDEALESLGEIMKSGLRAKDLIRRILTFSHRKQGDFKPVQLSQVVLETLKLVRASLPASMEIRSDIDPDTGYIMADLTQIQQVILNLCSNAEHAMRGKGGGVLEVRLVVIEPDAENDATPSSDQSEKRLKLTISDNGHGMDKSVIDHIFEPFYTTKQVGEGTGLGLSAVHGIVASHGGAVSVFSDPGKGTTFAIYFPQTMVEKQEQERQPEPVPRGSECILFVDDETQITRMASQALERLGYEVVAATRGEEALQLFTAQPDRFDLVITDQSMPGISGDALVVELMRIRPDLPVIMCTGYSSEFSADQARQVGIREYLMKPFLSRDLGFAIRKALDPDE